MSSEHYIKITITCNENFISHQIADSRIVECHQSLKQNDVGGVGICWVWKTFVLDERILGNGNSLVAFFHLFKGLISEVEIQRIGVVEVVLRSVNAMTKT